MYRFSDKRFIFCCVFSIVFQIGVQTTTATDENEKLNFKTECEDDGIDVLFNINLTVPKVTGKASSFTSSIGATYKKI
jgi:hypothetical protein